MKKNEKIANVIVYTLLYGMIITIIIAFVKLY